MGGEIIAGLSAVDRSLLVHDGMRAGFRTAGLKNHSGKPYAMFITCVELPEVASILFSECGILLTFYNAWKEK